ncbi:hypothetical protein GUITHDRAFT_108097 [Guillardia theta CCMP2712]|uniref:Uncharacterized protein n=1 Tax=Guillardia theta (strain CCMP2712) TaxID=905079 RepID=L1JCL0_GUITC|nr:hypothetical protein GUITHDRAFT_108097 [Guillardia theta CCMP2712]EKX46062.1 hypothetical protein GUITHDRAFT_108097 [Guillardia theta CCMP2712]|eukprot:XP_005833042.1 hypothetical protein GUITHDRAFT_108097 [Guillardia theta CCMP2712]
MVVKVPSLWQAGKSPSLNESKTSSFSARLAHQSAPEDSVLARSSLTERSSNRKLVYDSELKDISLSGLGSQQMKSWNQRLGETISEFDEYEELVKKEIELKSNRKQEKYEGNRKEKVERPSTSFIKQAVISANESFIGPTAQGLSSSRQSFATPPVDDQLPCQYVSLTPRKLRLQPMLCLPLEVSSKTVSPFWRSKHDEAPTRLGTSKLPTASESQGWKVDAVDKKKPDDIELKENEEYKLIIEHKLLSCDVLSPDPRVGDEAPRVSSLQEENSSSSSGSSMASTPRVARERITSVKDFMKSNYRRWAADWNPEMKAAWEGSAKRLEMLQRDEIVLLHHLEGDLNEKTFTCSSISADIFSAPSPLLAEKTRESYLIDETQVEDDSRCFLERRRHFVPTHKSSSYESSTDLSQARSPLGTAPSMENLEKESEEEFLSSAPVLPINGSSDSPRRLDASWLRSSVLQDSTKTPPRYGAPRYVFGNTDKRLTAGSTFSQGTSVQSPLVLFPSDAQSLQEVARRSNHGGSRAGMEGSREGGRATTLYSSGKTIKALVDRLGEREESSSTASMLTSRSDPDLENLRQRQLVRKTMQILGEGMGKQGSAGDD